VSYPRCYISAEISDIEMISKHSRSNLSKCPWSSSREIDGDRTKHRYDWPARVNYRMGLAPLLPLLPWLTGSLDFELPIAPSSTSALKGVALSFSSCLNHWGNRSHLLFFTSSGLGDWNGYIRDAMARRGRLSRGCPTCRKRKIKVCRFLDYFFFFYPGAAE
jgi:hypothetical protein